MGSERRVHERFDVHAHVEVEANDELFLFMLRNISRGGALLALPKKIEEFPVDLGDELSTFLDFGSDALGENLALSLEGQVVRFVEEDGLTTAIGLRWTGGSSFNMQKLVEIVEKLEDQSQRRPA